MYNIIKDCPASIFRAYDIRGIVDETFTPDIVYTIGLAIGSEGIARGQKQFIIGRDGRLSGPTLLNALSQGLRDSGCDVINIGSIPTPVLYFATYHLPAHSGVMLTGSHNPPNYNGLKIVIGHQTLAEEEIQKLYQRTVKGDFSRGNGSEKSLDVIEDYIQRITSQTKLPRKLKVVIDCGNGISGIIAPRLFKALGCEVHELFCEVDGRFPNHHPDPSIPENLEDLIAAVKETKADVGFAFDGDGDRCGLIDNKGQVIWPDRQMMLFSIDVLKRNPKALIIFDVKSTKFLSTVIEQHQGQPLMWKTGHSLLKAKLHETGSPLAGEMSGHIFFKDRWYGFDDGIYTAVRFLEILAQGTKSASEIFAELPDSVNTPELKVAIAEERKIPFIEEFKKNAQFADGKLTTIDGVRVDFPYGFGLVRFSNTTPYLTLRFEADTEANLENIKQQFKTKILGTDASLKLPF